MSPTIIIIVLLSVIGLSSIITLFSMFKKGKKLASKLPADFLIVFLLFAALGLIGFLFRGGVSQTPVLVGLLVLLLALTVGTVLMYRLDNQWEWSASASLAKKFWYLFRICLVAVLAFLLIFLLTEHRGALRNTSAIDVAWYLGGLIFTLFLPRIIMVTHAFWNEIPKIAQIKPVYHLPLGGSRPFIEPGGATLSFLFVIPRNINSEDKIQSKVRLPLNKSLQEAFTYNIYEHNYIKRHPKKIVIAEDNKKSKAYGWSFYQVRKIWWGFWTKKNYLYPDKEVGGNISNGSIVYVERVKIWEQ